MNDTYEAWVMMNSENDVVTEEYDNPEEALKEMRDRGYTIKELHEGKFTLNRLLCSKDCWLECLDEIDY